MLSVSVCLFLETFIYDNENVDEEINNAKAWQQGEGDEGIEEGIWENGKRRQERSWFWVTTQHLDGVQNFTE